ncbi:hypothetical protein COCSUDRAFT_61550 [Coccomyxa subellipsoidea C-169]|uniref:Uncharacterized protein n=1 Tax=Coccomyxa subellipsoidea (strain C-169) TaxID=574566 RepID=I0Z3V9_COCSC|nr:hypothetical protein COCSUDRAFT_61550 [Coccomyxa subellipsoidea C-169]EIE25328.1 hypothetical protein COCSUDRAFT_61550 [Coccomyxa subellipsoidea C-169]|eukprot:XP_005649872.1 hypothetical protein COCSUDRAFT_61550 [Coccomyxa subellipsoidea C-169]
MHTGRAKGGSAGNITLSLAPVIKLEVGGQREGGRSGAQGGPAGARGAPTGPGPGPGEEAPAGSAEEKAPGAGVGGARGAQRSGESDGGKKRVAAAAAPTWARTLHAAR